MPSHDGPAVTVLLDGADAAADAWRAIGPLADPDTLPCLPDDALVLRPAAGALPGPHLLERLLAAHTTGHTDRHTDGHRDGHLTGRPAAARAVPVETAGACLLGTAAQLRGGGEPVLAPTATVHLDVRADAAGDRAEPRPAERRRPDESDDTFLSVVVRTQGTRPQCLEEALLSLAGQTDRSFEVVLAGHRLDDTTRGVVEEVLAGQPAWLRARTTLLPVDSGGRSAPLNAGFAAARGEYVAILDDDDVVLAHWVETFRELARTAPGRTLRAAPMQQQVEAAEDAGRRWPRAVAPLLLPWPLRFDLVDHLVENRTPCMAAAFPLATVREHGLRFDEDLSTTEDWDFLVRAAAVTGVADSPEITSVYRWWMDAGSSRHLHAEADWDANHERVVAGFDALGLRLPPGAVRRLHAREAEHRQALADLESAHRREVEALREQVQKLTRRVRRLKAADDTADDTSGDAAGDTSGPDTGRRGGFLRRRGG